jgi:hypothetical protein
VSIPSPKKNLSSEWSDSAIQHLHGGRRLTRPKHVGCNDVRGCCPRPRGHRQPPRWTLHRRRQGACDTQGDWAHPLVILQSSFLLLSYFFHKNHVLAARHSGPPWRVCERWRRATHPSIIEEALKPSRKLRSGHARERGFFQSDLGVAMSAHRTTRFLSTRSSLRRRRFFARIFVSRLQMTDHPLSLPPLSLLATGYRARSAQGVHRGA